MEVYILNLVLLIPCCYCGRYNVPTNRLNSRLDVDVLSNYTTNDLGTCASTCLYVTECLTVNYNMSSRWCELINVTASLHTSYVITSKGVVIVDIMEYGQAIGGRCSNKPCGNLEVCIPTADSYICVPIGGVTYNHPLTESGESSNVHIEVSAISPSAASSTAIHITVEPSFSGGMSFGAEPSLSESMSVSRSSQLEPSFSATSETTSGSISPTASPESPSSSGSEPSMSMSRSVEPSFSASSETMSGPMSSTTTSEPSLPSSSELSMSLSGSSAAEPSLSASSASTSESTGMSSTASPDSSVASGSGSTASVEASGTISGQSMSTSSIGF